MIRINNLEKIYRTGEIEVRAVNGVDLHIKTGEFVSIMGPSGSGKSTMMNILGCLDKASGGQYILDGVDIMENSDSELSKIRNEKIGFVFQAFNLLPKLTILENVELPMFYAGVSPKESHQIAMNALTKVGLKDRVNHRPNEISGGQKQRVAIARSLVNSPAVILADEPTGNLDSKSESEIMSIFKSLNKEGVTIVMVTHEESVAEHTKRIVRFKDGDIVADELL